MLHYSFPYESIKHQIDVRITPPGSRNLLSKPANLLPSQTSRKRKPIKHTDSPSDFKCIHCIYTIYFPASSFLFPFCSLRPGQQPDGRFAMEQCGLTHPGSVSLIGETLSYIAWVSPGHILLYFLASWLPPSGNSILT
jgi:hypothetical protein